MLLALVGPLAAQPVLVPELPDPPPPLAKQRVFDLPPLPAETFAEVRQLPPPREAGATPVAMQDEVPKAKVVPPAVVERARKARATCCRNRRRCLAPTSRALRSLPEGQQMLGATPRPTEEDLKEFNQFIDTVIDPRNTLNLIENRTRIILLKETPTQIQVADESILGQNLLNPKQLIIVGRKIGTTVLTFWFPDPKDKTKDKILSYLVRVLPDPDTKKQLEATYQALEIEINKVFPDNYIKLKLVGDKVVVTGQCKDTEQAIKILQVIRANAPGGTNESGNSRSRLPITNLNLALSSDTISPNTPGLDSFITAGGPNVINLIRIPGEQQVNLRVTVAEVNRTAARSIGVNFNVINNRGTTVFGQLTGGIQIPQGGVLAQGANANVNGGVQANLPVILDNGQLPLAINALKTLNYARSLAEPTLVALNGQTASFQSGGQFPVPVIGGFGGSTQGSGLQGVQFIPFGVQVTFSPIITDRDRIRLQMQANVSTRDTSTGSSIGGSSVPGLNTRNFNTTVEMREGQTLAVAGLIQNNLGSQSNRVPFFGNIPILNRFAGFDQMQSGEQELIILVTPDLVHPLDKKDVPKVPGSDLFAPSDLEFYVFGRLEGRRSMDYRAPVMNDIHRMMNYHRCEQRDIFGPVGHTDDPNYPFDPYDQYNRTKQTPPQP